MAKTNIGKYALFGFLGLLGLVILVVGGFFGFKLISSLLKKFKLPSLFKKPVELGGPCTLHTDCKDALEKGNRCCGPVGNQVCTEPNKDWLDVAACPSECVGWLGGPPGSCGQVGKKELGEQCSASEECKGFAGAGKEGTFCCVNKDGKKSCQQMKKDHAGIWYCPDECAGWFGGPVGTCGTKGTKNIGDSCKYTEECKGSTGFGAAGTFCCPKKSGGKTCQNKKKDHAGVYYCPEECVGWLAGPKGTCGTKGTKNIGDLCIASPECKGYAGPGAKGNFCCKTRDGSKRCQQMKKDHIGTYYCPEECVGWLGGPPGSCGRLGTKGSGESCTVPQECKGFQDAGKQGAFCCQGKCRQMKKDHAGVWYCPNECVGWLGGPKGSCGTKGTKALNQSCRYPQECAGYIGPNTKNSAFCCSKKCKRLVKDWTGAYYCPEVAVLTPKQAVKKVTEAPKVVIKEVEKTVATVGKTAGAVTKDVGGWIGGIFG